MSRSLFVLAVLCLFAGCKSKVDEPVAGVQVRFNVLGLDVVQEAMVAARQAVSGLDDPADAGLTELWVLEGDSVLCHQLSSEAEFGSPELMLTVGAHSLTFIGSSRGGQQVVDGVWSASSVSDTYGAVLDVQVVSGMAAQSVVMSHVNYLINWCSTDVVVNSAFEAEITISSRRSSLKAGLAAGDAGSEYKFSFDPRAFTGRPLDVSVSGVCGALGVEDSVVTTLVVKDGNGNVLCSYSKGVKVLGNRKTKVTGAMFGGTKSAVKVNNQWLEDYEVEI